MQKVPGEDREALRVHWNDIVDEPGRVNQVFEDWEPVVVEGLYAVSPPFFSRSSGLLMRKKAG